MPRSVPILRIFEVRTKPGCSETLLENFRTTSADVVRGMPGNLGYFFGPSVPGQNGNVIFVSVWEYLDAVKKRFGEQWQESFLPEGYEDLIAECSLKHVNVNSGWHVTMD